MDELEKNSSTEPNEKQSAPFNASGEKRVDIGILLALFLGYFGAHHFYLGRWKMGIAYLILGLLTFLSIPLALIDCFRMKGLVARANNTQDSSVATPPLANGTSPKQSTLLGMPAKYVLGFAGGLGGLIVIMIGFSTVSTMKNLKENQKEFELNRDEIVAVAQKALDEGDFNKAKSIGLKHELSHDPELGKILTISNAKLAEIKQRREAALAGQRKVESEKANAQRKAEIAKANAERVSNITWREFDSIYNLQSDATDLQKESEWKKYKGKTIQWSGEVFDIGESFGSLTLSIKMNSDTFTFDLLVFLRKEAKDDAISLRKGDPVTFQADLDSWGGLLPTNLKNGIIVK
ncbi:MAG: NINE protein [Verrucomicrobiota bacterium]